MGTVTVMRADAAKLPLRDRAVRLTLYSPPYCEARSYDDGTLPPGHKVARECAEWIDWQLWVGAEALRVTDGPVIVIAACVTRKRTYWPAVEGLAYRWWAEGWGENGPGTYEFGSAYRPVYWVRDGIPGSGGDQWFKAKVEYCLCLKRPGPLPYANNTAMGRPPKYQTVGGAMSNRTADGRRRNARTGSRLYRDKKCGTSRRPNGKRKNQEPSGVARPMPEIANPGNVIKTHAGGGHLGSKLAHENEAPFPEVLPEWFIKSLTRPGDTVLDCFGGSGTTGAVAKRLGRNAILCDIRASQVALSKRRTAAVQRELLIG